MCPDAGAFLRELEQLQGDGAMSRPTPEERAWAVAHEFRDYLIHDGSTAAFNALVERVTAAIHEAEPAAALLAELDELRALTHDLLLDRDAAYGREVGRGEALAAAEKWWEDVQDVDREVGRLFDAIRGPTPVRPLPPPERLAARCRALEDALRAVASAWDDPGAPLSPQGAVDAARKLLEEISAGK
jgi:hypothetical protein